MAARDLFSVLTATALERPTGPEAVDAAAQAAEVISLGAAIPDLDPRAQQGIEMLAERIRTQFTLPALATDSSDALANIWVKVAGPTLRLMDAIAVLLHEGARSSPNDLMIRRLEHGDKAAITKLADALKAAGRPSLAEKLRRTSLLISDARARLREHVATFDEVDVVLLKGFHQGVLMWGLGIGLCVEIVGRSSNPVDAQRRADLISDAVNFTADGARFAGYFASLSAGLKLEATSPEDFKPLLSNDDAIAFLVGATREIPRTFGPNTHYRLEFFRYPDAPAESEYHIVIDSGLPPHEANERLDALCDHWWDTAQESLGMDVFPVLGVIDDD